MVNRYQSGRSITPTFAAVLLQRVCGLGVNWLIDFGFSAALRLPCWSVITIGTAATLTVAFLWVITKVSHGGAWSWSGQRLIGHVTTGSKGARMALSPAEKASIVSPRGMRRSVSSVSWSRGGVWLGLFLLGRWVGVATDGVTDGSLTQLRERGHGNEPRPHSSGSRRN